MKTAFVTDVGKLREHNEDAGGVFVNKAGEYLAVVADGMGGHQAGDVASQIAKEMLETAWCSIDQSFTPQSAEEWLTNKISDVNKAIFHRAQEERSLSGMGTTIVAALCTNHFVALAHVGDSRAYFITKEALLLKTEDHSLVNELKKNGQITEAEAENHPRKNVLIRALGTERETKSESVVLEWEEGQGILLCSDGLTNKLNSDELHEVMLLNLPLPDQAQKIVHMANERGGEDNITLALVLHEPQDKEGITSCQN